MEIVEAIYEKGTLKPLKKLNLREGEKVKIILKKDITKKTKGIISNCDIKRIVEEIENESFL
ncbi:MAG: antitoxin family protein [Candidatus Aenigmatarchaeota archaeon]